MSYLAMGQCKTCCVVKRDVISLITQLYSTRKHIKLVLHVLLVYICGITNGISEIISHLP